MRLPGFCSLIALDGLPTFSVKMLQVATVVLAVGWVIDSSLLALMV